MKFFIQSGKQKYLVEYEAHLGLLDNMISIPKESITFFTHGAGWKGERFISIDNPYYELSSITNDVKSNLVIKGSGFDYGFINAPDKLAVSCASRGLSFFFNPSIISLLKENKGDLSIVLDTLASFANERFFVIKVGQLAEINSSRVLPLNVSDVGSDYMIYGCIPLFLNGSGNIPKVLFLQLDSIIQSINTALCAIIPRLKITYNKVGEETDANGLELVKIEMLSERDGKKFSTKYESEGIKRIISLLSCLVSVFNNIGTTLVVDELDSGIFEYLLGELLCSIDKEAKGQLIFTSHNLRAFEKLPNDCIVCSTVNPANRYVRLTGINRNNNKRDFYIRSLVLGGQKETLYDGDDLDNIGYAFRKAGRQ